MLYYNFIIRRTTYSFETIYFIIQNEIHISANIWPSSGRLEKTKKRYSQLHGFDIYKYIVIKKYLT